ncbi:unnamed protein product [Didymodactylos carnosus]|uniref:Carrier domain-containing protein n=1 Tax=Didymodactylos carnosus TaxID=1234261 RepID=A0A814R252_9BILA|nr:unnamed protein product [Didymodactylos carnosus]CAF3891369.1 unnamed protein product [Didymodactylos carnosus]
MRAQTNDLADSNSSKEKWTSLGITQGRASYGQERIWFDEEIRFNGRSRMKKAAMYNIPLCYKVKHGSVSIERVRQALSIMVDEHSILRTSLSYDTEQQYLKQEIASLNNSVYSFQLSTIQNERQIKEIMKNEKINSSLFDLEQGRVFRCHLIRRSDSSNSNDDLLNQNDLLLFNVHHSAFDGYSQYRLFPQYLHSAYMNTTSERRQRQLQYIDYSTYERQMNMSDAKHYWQQLLDGYNIDRQLTLPYDYRHEQQEQRTGIGATVTFELDSLLVESMVAYASEMNVSLYQLCLSSYYSYLFKQTQDQDLCVGAFYDNRYQPELQFIVGMFTNLLPLRLHINPRQSFRDLVAQVKHLYIESMIYCYMPYQQIIDLHRQQQSSLVLLPFIQTTFIFTEEPSNNFQLYLDDNTVLSEFNIHDAENKTGGISKFDLTLSVDYEPVDTTLNFTFEYSLDLFEHSTIELISHRFRLLLKEMFSSPSSIDKPLYKLSILLPHEASLINELNITDVTYEQQQCIHQQFAFTAQHHPQKVSVVLDEQSLTYCELLYYVQLVSLSLMNDYNVKPQQTICQCLDQSIEMVTGILSILTCGATYCPLSPQDPQQRLLSMVDDVQAETILVHHKTQEKFAQSNITAINIESLIENLWKITDRHLSLLSTVHVSINDQAYLIFTSGSTGHPKGVIISHINFSSFTVGLNIMQMPTNSEVVLQLSQCLFDVHISEILGSVIVGYQLVLLHPNGLFDLEYLSATIKSHQITQIDTVPTYCHTLCEFWTVNKYERFDTIRSWIMGGEKLYSKTISELLPFVAPQSKCKIFNLYGPTECTISTTCHAITTEDLKSHLNAPIPIGRPLRNYHCYVLDDYLEPVIPSNQTGELYVGGPGVFLGYFNRPDLTKQALVNINGEQCYRTGDLIKLKDNGEMVYVGRRDFQIKLRGQRVEIGEIEQTILRASSSIDNCIVVTQTDNKQQEHLLAYIESSTITESSSVRQYCQSQLPRYMIPSLFIILEKLPLNASGKVDRKQLVLPDLNQQFDEDEYCEPQTELQWQIHDMWCQLLNKERISLNTNFFSLGENSLSLTKLYNEYKLKYSLKSNIGILFKHATINGHAKLIETYICQRNSNNNKSEL